MKNCVDTNQTNTQKASPLPTAVQQSADQETRFQRDVINVFLSQAGMLTVTAPKAAIAR